MTQTDRILKALQSGQKLTPMAALKRFGCFRLAARVADLRRAGYDISATIVKRAGKRYAAYSL